MRAPTGFENSLAQWTKPGGREKAAYVGIKGAPSACSPFLTAYVTMPPTYCRALVARLGA